MGLFGKIFIPIISAVVLLTGIIGFYNDKTINTLIQERVNREISLQKKAHDDHARDKLSEIHHLTELTERLNLEKSASFSALDFVKESYESAHLGHIDDESDPLVRQERNYLKDKFSPIESAFTKMTDNSVMYVHFHLSNNRSFARVWRDGWQAKRGGKKVDISDDLSSFRKTVIKVNANHKPITGIELGRGGFVIRGIAPVFSTTGSPVGSVETYSSYNSILNNIKTDKGMSISLLMPKDKLAVASSMKDTKKFPLFDNIWVQAYSSNAQTLKNTYQTKHFSTAFAQENYQYETANQVIHTQVVKDFSGKKIGFLLITQDLTALNEALLATKLTGDKQRKSALISSIILLVAIVIIVSCIISYIARKVRRSVQDGIAMLNEMESGNLDKRIEIKSHDEVSTLAKSLNKFADNLRDEVVAAFKHLADGNLTFEAQGVIKTSLNDTNAALQIVMQQVHSASEEIASDSAQVSGMSQSLSDGASGSAASLEEITSSLTQLSSQTNLNAENASQVNLLSSEAKQVTEDGKVKMNQMISAMTDINEASHNISKIIKVIDEIAFQTNLLALNAAVEAARAGQHGKGFAVVAEEVRNLAARSAKAASETADLIEGSVQKTENGTTVANQTAESLEAIYVGISKVSNLAEEIAAASQEQAEGISQINLGLGQIDQTIQQNTANAEESAATAEELSSQAEELQRILQGFTLNKSYDSQLVIESKI